MTHFDNFESILQAGELRSYNLMNQGVPAYTNISNEDVQSGRANIVVPPTGKPLHDYVPLYFGNRTPMVAVNKNVNEKIIFLRFSLNILALGDIVITDGNARSGSTVFKSYTQLNDLDILKPSSINTVYYAHDPEIKRQKQAELLIPDRLSITHLLDIICFSQNTRIALLALLTQYGIKCSVQVQPGTWYFRTRPAKGSSTP